MFGSRSELASTFRTWKEGGKDEERREASPRRAHGGGREEG